jgi:hypothetical protein
MKDLLYDFTLETGDTLPYNMISGEVAVIEKTDSVLVDGTYRKRMLFLQAYNTCMWGRIPLRIIEGIWQYTRLPFILYLGPAVLIYTGLTLCKL